MFTTVLNAITRQVYWSLLTDERRPHAKLVMRDDHMQRFRTEMTLYLVPQVVYLVVLRYPELLPTSGGSHGRGYGVSANRAGAAQAARKTRDEADSRRLALLAVGPSAPAAQTE
jgi:hypothetical protein